MVDWLTLQGQNRDHTIIKLDDGAPGFGDPRRPESRGRHRVAESLRPRRLRQPGLQQLRVRPDGGRRQRQPGRCRPRLHGGQQGAIRNVALVAGPGSGSRRGSPTRNSGPALVDNVRISGFDVAVRLGYAENGATLRSVRLDGQRTAGILSAANAVTAKDLRSANVVPAIVNGDAPASTAFLTLVDSGPVLRGHRAGRDREHGSVFIRGTKKTGYPTTVRQDGQDVDVPDLAEWHSGQPLTAGSPTAPSLALPASALSTPADLPLSQWAGVNRTGAVPDDPRDDTQGIQAALGSGQPVVYFPSGRYRSPARSGSPTPSNGSKGSTPRSLTSGGVFGAGSQAAVFTTAGDSPDALRISQSPSSRRQRSSTSRGQGAAPWISRTSTSAGARYGRRPARSCSPMSSGASRGPLARPAGLGDAFRTWSRPDPRSSTMVLTCESSASRGRAPGRGPRGTGRAHRDSWGADLRRVTRGAGRHRLQPRRRRAARQRLLPGRRPHPHVSGAGAVGADALPSDRAVPRSFGRSVPALRLG